VLGAGTSGRHRAAGIAPATRGHRHSGDPDDIALIPTGHPRARSPWASDAVANAGIVVLAIPCTALRRRSRAAAGKVVVDAMNYWPASDGVLTAFEPASAAGRAAARSWRAAGRLAVVKALNPIGYHELEDRPGRPARRTGGLRLAATTGGGRRGRGADQPASATNPVRLGGLPAGRVLQPGGPVFGQY